MAEGQDELEQRVSAVRTLLSGALPAEAAEHRARNIVQAMLGADADADEVAVSAVRQCWFDEGHAIPEDMAAQLVELLAGMPKATVW